MIRKILVAVMVGGFLALPAVAGAAAAIKVSVYVGPQVTEHVHGICKNPKGNNDHADIAVYCPYYHTVSLKPPLEPTLTVAFKIHTYMTPQLLILVVKLYKWPSHGDHAHLYTQCINPAGHRVDCDHSWVTKDLPPPGESDIYRFKALCEPGRYYVLFTFHGITSTGQTEHGYWYEPHPSNKSDQVQPNRQESHEISQC